jgi:hypothetical protein
MINPRFLPSLILIAVLLGACAPAENPITSGLPTPTAVEPAAPNSTEFSSIIPTLAAATQVQVSTEAPPATLLPVATSRGPDLEATDPTTVNLASGQVQFVEFFRFT